MLHTDSMVEDGGFALVGEFSTAAEAQEYALVVLAMNLDCWIKMEAGGTKFLIFADPAFAVAISEEFELYAAEQRQPKPETLELPLFKSGVELAFLWVTALLVVFGFQSEDPTIADRYCNSSLALFERGEWWRPLTSLFLHSDFHHLLGNVCLGVIFCVLVANSVGPVLGWSLIFASGVAGNILTAAIRYPDAFQSLGASTATFGALGMLVGVGVHVAWRSRSYRKLWGVLVPIGAGVVLLGWFGSGGARTDVLGHAMGFAAGGLLGAAASWRQMRASQTTA
jgi:membrane associated rhomboid family serine protease